MKKLLPILLFLVSGVMVDLRAQTYVVDILFGRDSVALTPYVQGEKPKAARSKKKEPAADPIYLKAGETVQLVSVEKDSLKLVDRVKERVVVQYDGKPYTMRAGNLRFSDQNPEGTVDTLKAKLTAHQGMDIHGKHRWLFRIWLVWILLAAGLLCAILINCAGTRWVLPLLLTLGLLWAYVLTLSLAASAWMISSELTSLPSAIITSVLILSWFSLVLRIIIRYLKSKEASKILLAILIAVFALPLLVFAYLSLFWILAELSVKYWWAVGIIALIFFLPDFGGKVMGSSWEEEWDRARAKNRAAERRFREEQKQWHP